MTDSTIAGLMLLDNWLLKKSWSLCLATRWTKHEYRYRVKILYIRNRMHSIGYDMYWVSIVVLALLFNLKVFQYYYSLNCKTCMAKINRKKKIIWFLVFNATFSYIMATSFSGGRNRREPDHGQVTGKLLVYHLWLRVQCTLFVIYKAVCEPTPYWW